MGVYPMHTFQREEWTILSNGPSIAKLTEADLPSDVPIIGINGAGLHPEIRIDIFSAQENYEDVWDVLFCRVSPRWLVAWVPEYHARCWLTRIAAKRAACGAHELSLDIRPWSDEGPRGMRAWLPWDSGVLWGHTTLTATIAHASKRGARRIHVFGAEMEGTESFGLNAQRPHTEARWAYEREMLYRAVAECEANGVEVILRHA